MFLDEKVLPASHDPIPWFDDFANYLASDLVPINFSSHQQMKFMHDVKNFFCDESCLYRSRADEYIHRCVPEVEMWSVLEACHSSPIGGHHSGVRTVHNILHC